MKTLVGRRVTAVFVTSSLAVTMISCNRTSEVDGEGRLDPGGRVLLTKRGGTPITVAKSRPLHIGDTIEVVEGTARVTLPGGEVIELQPRSSVVFNRGPELRGGDLLLTTSGQLGTVKAGGSAVGVNGAARVTLAPALRIATYQGTASLRSAGRLLVVPALRSAEVSLVGLLPGSPSPLVIDRSDPWVSRFLGEAAEQEAAMESRARGFSGQISAKDAASPAFYRGLLRGLAAQSDFQQDDVDRLGRTQPDGPLRAGEVLVGSAIALQGRRGTFADRLLGAAAFRAEGAAWAVVAADQQVPSLAAVLRLIDDAINVSPIGQTQVVTVSPTPVVTAAPAARTTRTTSTTSPGKTVTTPNTLTTQPTVTSATPVPIPPVAPPPLIQLEPLIDTTVDPVVDLLADLLGRR